MSQMSAPCTPALPTPKSPPSLRICAGGFPLPEPRPGRSVQSTALGGQPPLVAKASRQKWLCRGGVVERSHEKTPGLQWAPGCMQ